MLNFYNICPNISRPPDAYNDVLRNLVDHDKAHEGIYVSYIFVMFIFLLQNYLVWEVRI